MQVQTANNEQSVPAPAIAMKRASGKMDVLFLLVVFGACIGVVASLRMKRGNNAAV